MAAATITTVHHFPDGDETSVRERTDVDTYRNMRRRLRDAGVAVDPVPGGLRYVQSHAAMGEYWTVWTSALTIVWHDHLTSRA